MKKIIFLFLSFYFFQVQAQEFADKKFYLIDSLVLEGLSDYDRELLDKQLKAYHEEDTYLKLAHLDTIIDFSIDHFIWESYNKPFWKDAIYFSKQFNEGSIEWEKVMSYYVNAIHNNAEKFDYREELDSAIFYYELSLEMYKEFDMKQNIGETMNVIAVILNIQNRHYEAIELMNKSFEYLDTNLINTALCYSNYANMIGEQKNYEEALIFKNKALKIMQKNKDEEGVVYELSDIANLKIEQGKLEEADSIFQYILPILNSIEDLRTHVHTSIYNIYGLLLYKQNKLDSAQIVYEEVMNNSEINDFTYYFIESNVMLAEIAGLKEEYDKCKKYATIAYGLAHDYDLNNLISSSLSNLILIAKHEKNYKLAFEYQEEFIIIENEFVNKEKKDAILKQALNFQFDKQKEINDLQNQQKLDLAEAQKQKTRIGLIAATFIAGLIALFSILIFNRLKLIRKQKVKLDDAYAQLEESKKNELAVSNLKALQSQMNPHFIFNALNSVQDLVLLQDIRSSNKYLGKFSDLIRKILLSSKEQFISLEEEVEILGLYLDLEKLRFGDEFQLDFSCQVSEEKQEDIQLPAMFIQPYIENAIKHGLFNKKGEKRLKVAFSLINESTLECIVEDNGVGQKQAAQMKQERLHLHTGFSTEAINERIRLLNQTLDKKIDIQIIDLEENGAALGTKIILHFPI